MANYGKTMGTIKPQAGLKLKASARKFSSQGTLPLMSALL